LRYLVISDIHANLEAYDATMAAAKPLACDRVLVLGDLVGYGADPNAVIERVRALAPHTIIRGNHDKVGAGVETPEGFNAVARNAIQWTYDALTPENRSWLAALPAGPVLVDELIEVCHGTPFDEDAYVFDDLDALRSLNASERPLCLFGHTHVQVGYSIAHSEFGIETADDSRPLVLSLRDRAKYLINPGSVGQPRDGDPRAGFAVVDTQARQVTLYRISYPLGRAQERIIDAGLPEILAQRLAHGR
jgi:predicted phosphodiesterase